MKMATDIRIIRLNFEIYLRMCNHIYNLHLWKYVENCFKRFYGIIIFYLILAECEVDINKYGDFSESFSPWTHFESSCA